MSEEESVSDRLRDLDYPRHADEVDRLVRIVQLTKQARAAQKKYFQTRDRSVLVECKQLERKLDDALANG